MCVACALRYIGSSALRDLACNPWAGSPRPKGEKPGARYLATGDTFDDRGEAWFAKDIATCGSLPCGTMLTTVSRARGSLSLPSRTRTGHACSWTAAVSLGSPFTWPVADTIFPP